MSRSEDRRVTRLKEHFRWNWDDGWQPKRPTVERLTVRLTDRTFRALDALALERGVTRTGLVKTTVNFGPDATRSRTRPARAGLLRSTLRSRSTTRLTSPR